MFKKFFTKKVLEMQMKNAPKEQREMVMKILENNPELFSKINAEVKALKKGGKNEMAAMMEVMKKYGPELQQAMGGPRQSQRPF